MAGGDGGATATIVVPPALALLGAAAAGAGSGKLAHPAVLNANTLAAKKLSPRGTAPANLPGRDEGTATGRAFAVCTRRVGAPARFAERSGRSQCTMQFLSGVTKASKPTDR
jgi:hypothetical protein